MQESLTIMTIEVEKDGTVKTMLSPAVKTFMTGDESQAGAEIVKKLIEEYFIPAIKRNATFSATQKIDNTKPANHINYKN